uniref:Sesquipedalian n=1 Tax=Sphenodon punctatus TaxID=8508 RepID=A0A8D0L740_SPHPU
MKLNERSLAFYATCDSPADNAGFLYKKGERNTAYHKRWFVLKGNMLFYFEDRESREPVGVIILEGCTVELCESTEEFAFAIRFDCAKSRTYILAADSQASMEAWVKSLSRASFDYMRLVVKELEKQLEEMQRGWSPPCGPLKENGCAVWNNAPPLKPPPLPPRRRTAGFSTLHELYGREVAELRREWLPRLPSGTFPCLPGSMGKWAVAPAPLKAKATI